MTPAVCQIPPEGWWCSREAGHEGPCAAREVVPPCYAKLIADLRAPLYWSAENGPDDSQLDISPRHASDALEIVVGALLAIKRVTRVCEGTSYDLIASYADNALKSGPQDGFWVHHPAAKDQNGDDDG